MKRALTIVVGGIAVCLFLGGVPVLCQMVPAPAAAQQAPKVANAPIITAAAEHPLLPVIRWAEREHPNIAAITDYTAIMQKQENIGGEVNGVQVLEIKVRHHPFSVYTKFRFPQELNGQQAIYVQGKNDDKIIGHGVGFRRTFGSQKLEPSGLLAMRGQKYPITEMGLLNLTDRLLEVGYKDSRFDECVVKYTEGVTLFKNTEPRECTMIQVMHPTPRPYFIFYVALIYVDKELNLPIRYESYEWPRKEGEKPKLIEVYEYRNLKLNVGLTDKDFDPDNPEYAFP